MNRWGCHVLVLLMLLAAAAAVLPDVASAQQSSEPDRAQSTTISGWQRLVIVVFERRIPHELEASHRAGARLRSLRAEVVRRLTESELLRSGDHVDVFAEGMMVEELRCFLRGMPCGLLSRAELRWTDGPVSVRKLLTAFLRLPTAAAEADRVRTSEGVEFLSHRYTGDPTELDCAIRRSVTAPMTLGAGGPPNCPIEGEVINPRQARTFSRVELTYAVQISEALRAHKDRHRIQEVVFVWALLRDKNFETWETIPGIRRDFGERFPQLKDYYDKAAAHFVLRPDYEPSFLSDGSAVRLYVVASRGTEKLQGELIRDGRLVRLEIGDRERYFVPADLDLRRPWTPGSKSQAPDRLRVRTGITAGANGQLFATSLRANAVDGTAESPVAIAEGGTADAQSAGIDSLYLNMLAGASFDSKDLKLDVELLVAAPGPDQRYGLESIPAIHIESRNFKIGLRSWTWGEWLRNITVLIALVWLTIHMVRAQPFNLEPNRKDLSWEVPLNQEPSRNIRIRGFTDQPLRLLFATRTKVAIEWSFIPGSSLPVESGTVPIALTVNGREVPPGAWLEETVKWRLGSRFNPNTLMSLEFTLMPDRFRLERVLESSKHTAVVRLNFIAEPRAILPLRRNEETLLIPVHFDLQEVAPMPAFRFEVDGGRRRLGLDGTEGAFGTLIVENCSVSGVSRLIQVFVRIEVDPNSMVSDLSIHFSDTQLSKVEGEIRNGQNSSWRVELAYRGKNRELPPHLLRGHLHAQWIDTGTGEVILVPPIEWKLTWLPQPTRVVALDIGTSGCRLFLEMEDRERSGMSEMVEFPLTPFRGSQADSAREFPSLVRFGADGAVIRVGGGGEGAHAGNEPGSRVVESPKAAMLAAAPGVGGAAQRDLRAYIGALGRSWRAVREERRLKATRIVATAPWAYGNLTLQWFKEAIASSFEGCAMVTVVREAEAAAFYHLRQSIVFSGGRHQERPLDREYRSLIIDVGAGTADYALIASRNIAGSSGEVKILGHTYCTWAGNRFDEVLLKEVFGHKDSVGALARDRRLRDDTRRFKERELNDLFQSADGATPTLGGKPAVIGFASDRQFLAAMDGYYAQAFDRPLRDLRELLGAENWIDEVVLAGRGVFAYGCFGRIEEQVLQNFRPHPSSARISIGHIGKENAEESIGRGALTFVRHGYIRGSHSDLSAVRDVALIADIDGHRAWKAIQHAGGALQTGRRSFRFPGEILGAWVVCGLPLLREAERNRCFDDLRNGKPLGPHEALLASWRPTALTQALTVELSGDEQAEFVGN